MPSKRPAPKRVKGPVPLERLARSARIGAVRLASIRQGMVELGREALRTGVDSELASSRARRLIWNALLPKESQRDTHERLFRNRALMRRCRRARVSMVDATMAFNLSRPLLKSVRKAWFKDGNQYPAAARRSLKTFVRTQETAIYSIEITEVYKNRQKALKGLRRERDNARAALKVLDALENVIVRQNWGEGRRGKPLLSEVFPFLDSMLAELEQEMNRGIALLPEATLQMRGAVRERFAPWFDLVGALMQWEEISQSGREVQALGGKLMRDFRLAQSPNPLMRHLRSRSRMN